MTAAVCYVATSSHLLQTVVSALQARAHTSSDTAVVVVQHQHDEDARRAFRRVCDDHGIVLVSAPDAGWKPGLHPVYLRLFLDRTLPSGLDDLLYLDGDTQVVGSLDPLLAASPPPGGVMAARDPMVLLQYTARFHDQVIGWWDESGIPAAIRPRYVNSGVLRLQRSDLAQLRDEVLRMRAQDGDPRFLDQDLLNRALGDRVRTVGMEWNLPAFLLGSPLVERMEPRVLHFMSEPRPWQGPYFPWGRRYFEPYADLVRRYPALTPYWSPARGSVRARYIAQQAYKRLVEQPVWRSRAAVAALATMRASDDALT